ncbi:1,2-phenylacetyl-CoA epoxidase subunit PaaD [Alicyclobacillus sendaiensis]|uniref:1,2-phenylacetyl-CoA epoxidase subunit PaaD n=1 Tax=Alicyclobacillus sendaiensis TaxID=192387 RepID=UPI0007849222|nr:1,2-phenylacetyl-CoA epoxidase subunit PaaD [Alicyclobacillus sendaiensis]
MTTRSLSEEDIWQVLAGVPDPELLVVSVVDLGMVKSVSVDDRGARVELIPTFLGCPALGWIAEKVRAALAERGVAADVAFALDVVWDPSRIAPDGIEKLRAMGVAVPAKGDAAPVVCPYCGARDTDIESLFGPTPCRAVYYCRACRQPFEAMKP